MTQPRTPIGLQETPGSDQPNRTVTLRAILLGLLGVALICGLTPYSDFAVANTYLVGNFLPIGLLLFFLLVVLLLNAPLSRFAPARALRQGELAVILGMALVSCALPSSGLMRYLPGSLVSFHRQAGENAQTAALFRDLRLPAWMFPAVAGETPGERASDRVIEHFWSRTPPDDPSVVPWQAWVAPAVSWGVLLLGLYGAVLCLMVLVRRQWAENERLPFPLATVYLSLVEPPPPGRALSPLFRSWAFWVAFGLVFTVHAFNALSRYYPRYVPAIPLDYELRPILDPGLLRFTRTDLKASTLYFSIVGICLFLQSKVSFSLWFFFLLFQVALVGYGSYGSDFTWPMQEDQTFGAVCAFALLVLWVGRHEWLLIVRQMLRGARPGEPRGRYLPYPVAGWGLLACGAILVGWLLAAGASVIGATVLVGMLLLLMVMIARVVAETGLIFAQLPVPLQRPWVYALDLPSPLRTTGRSFFFSAYFHELFAHDLREALPVYSLHAFRVADGAADPTPSRPRGGVRLFLCLVLALAVGYLVAGGSMLYVEYSHGVTLDAQGKAPINEYGVSQAPRTAVVEPTLEYLPPGQGPQEGHSRVGHFAFGATLTAVLGLLRMRLAAWPFHPIGFLLAFSYPIGRIWFSLFAGWLLKVLLVRFGGPRLLTTSRPFFLGLILGEAGAAACWLVVALVRNLLGLPYHAVNLMPT